MPQITLYGADTCRFTNRTRGQLDSLGVAYAFVDLQQDHEEGLRFRKSFGRNATPVVEIVNDGKTRRLVRPNDWQLETELKEAGVIAERQATPSSRSVIRGPRTVIGDRR